MNSLEKYLEKQQDDAAALEAISRALRAMSVRDEEEARALVVELSEMAFGLSRKLNAALDIVNLPKGGIA